MVNYKITVTVHENPNPSLAQIKAGEEFWNRVIDPVLEAHREEVGFRKINSK